MKSQSSLALTSILGITIILLVGGWVRGSHIASPREIPRVDAAFRDGLFQARLDVQNGRKARIASGRWSTDQDRASFIAGYQQTYRELADARSTKLTAPTSIELAGYRDGKVDGAHDRKAAEPFQGNKTQNYRKADQFYREAYSNGYQEGYYTGAKNTDLKTISEKSGPF